MSTLKVNTIQNASGGSASTTDNIQQGIAKAWVNFNGTTVTSSNDLTGVRDSFNIAGITDNDTGDYTITMTSGAVANANYAVVGSAGIANAFLSLYIHAKSTGTLQQDPTTTVFRVVTAYSGSNSNREDSSRVAVAVFGD